jgi:hypothetical protein
MSTGLQTYEEQLLESIDTLQAANADALVLPMTTVNQAIASLIDKNSTLIGKLQTKILRKLDHATTKNLDHLDGIYTRLLAGLDAYQFDADHLLQLLAAKGGAIKAGAPLETALVEEILKAPELAYGATLVLSVREAIPIFHELIEVLREIRDRMPPQAVRIKGEIAPASEPDEPEADTEESEPAEPEDELKQWPEV